MPLITMLVTEGILLWEGVINLTSGQVEVCSKASVLASESFLILSASHW